jgi:hypothetical protein
MLYDMHSWITFWKSIDVSLQTDNCNANESSTKVWIVAATA